MSLTNSHYFTTGAMFPPKHLTNRQRMFDDYYNLYKNEIGMYRILYPRTLLRIQREKGFTTVDQAAALLPKITINFFRKLSRYWANTLYGHQPVIDTGTPTGNARLKPFLRPLYELGEQLAIDSSRFGVGVCIVMSTTDPKTAFNRVDPRHWFPVVDPVYPDRVIGDVIVTPYINDPEKGFVIADRLRVIRMMPEEPITVQIFEIHGANIGRLLSTEASSTVLRNRAVFTVCNTDKTDHVGESDYDDIIPIMAEINRRFEGISVALDRHTNPHMAGPRSALVQSADGKFHFDIEGQYFPLEEDDIVPQYITWDAQLDANFRQIEHMLLTFHMLSDTSAAAFGIQGDGNAVESGSALRKQLHSSLLRLGALRRGHEAMLEDAISFVLPRADLAITWANPYLDGLVEEAQAEEIRIRTGTTTTVEAITRLDRVDSVVAARIAQQARLERPEREDEGQPQPTE